MGFEINPYDMCVANKIINGKKCTLTWYVDDNKVSHVEQTVVDEVIDKIEKRFPGLTVTKGNEKTFIGIKMRFLRDKKVAINIKDYILEVIDDFGEEISKIVALPAARWLFTTNKKERKLK